MDGDAVCAGRFDFLRGNNNVRFDDRRAVSGFVARLPERGDVINVDAELQHAGRLHFRLCTGNSQEFADRCRRTGK